MGAQDGTQVFMPVSSTLSTELSLQALLLVFLMIAFLTGVMCLSLMAKIVRLFFFFHVFIGHVYFLKSICSAHFPIY